MITSRQNSKIKWVKSLSSQAKFRKKDAAYVLEGIRLLEEAARSKQTPELVLFIPDLDQRGQSLVESYQKQNIPCEETAPEVLKAASDTENPQGIVAVFLQEPLPLPSMLNLILIADSIRDPGNLGTLMRTALAAGVDGLILSPGTVDPYSPKVIRSGMGAHFSLPILPATWDEIISITEGLTLYLADINQGKSLWDTDLTQRLGIIIGGEAYGPGKEARELAKDLINIPMNKK
ncbi:MAG: RNA methyltransferase [Chloroflexi bacterium]|nr:RNA methyltransferase [Chloroflexota bacterium]